MIELALLLAAGWLAIGLASLVLGRRVRGACALGVAVAVTALALGSDPHAAPLDAVARLWLAPFAAPLAGLVVASGSLGRTRVGRSALPLALGGAALAGPVYGLVSDPFLDVHCSVPCEHQPLALTYWDAGAVALPWLGAILVALALAKLAWADRSDPGRALVIAGCAAGAVSFAAGADRLLVVSGAVALVLAAADLRRLVVVRRTVDDLSNALRLASEPLESLLAERLGTGARIYYLSEATGGFVDRDGGPERDPAESRCHVTNVSSGDRVVAHVHHDADPDLMAEVAHLLAGPAWLSVEVGRLSVDVAVRGGQLQSASRRIVARADAERRDLERDVHDGAQQHLLALGLGLRAAQRGASPRSPQTLAVLDRCAEDVDTALDELRAVAHGIYPSGLATAGLAHALRTLALKAPVPVELSGPVTDPELGLDDDVARTVYLVVADAASHSAGALTVTSSLAGDELTIRIGGAPATPGEVLPDRVSAVAGRMSCERNHWEVNVSCGSSSVRTS